MPGSSIDQRWGEVRKESKKAVNPANISQNGKALQFNSEAEGQYSLRQAIMFDYKNKSSERHVKETVPIWSQNWLIPATL